LNSELFFNLSRGFPVFIEVTHGRCHLSQKVSSVKRQEAGKTSSNSAPRVISFLRIVVPHQIKRIDPPLAGIFTEPGYRQSQGKFRDGGENGGRVVAGGMGINDSQNFILEVVGGCSLRVGRFFCEEDVTVLVAEFRGIQSIGGG
jgi:hypothetical protein